MDLDNPFKVVVHYLLIERIMSLGHWDEVPMVSALVYMVTHWLGFTMSHDIGYRVVMTSPSCYIVLSQSWENIEFMPKLAMTLTYGEMLKWSYISYGLGHYWWK